MKGKRPLTDDELAEALIQMFQYSDAIREIHEDRSLMTRDTLHEIFWEYGYERAPFAAIERFAPLAKKYGLDLKASYDKGRNDRV